MPISKIRLPELFETHANLNEEEHLKNCENCTALVRDLEYIAQQAKLLLPIHDPSPGVWENIRSAIRNDSGPNDLIRLPCPRQFCTADGKIALEFEVVFGPIISYNG